MPEQYPCVELMSLTDRQSDDECYGVYGSERKARNALSRLAVENHLCHALLGIGESAASPCMGCALDERANCASKTPRLRQFTKAVVALAPLRISKWPYDGPIGVRERADLHILEDWRYLGTAQSEQDIYPILEARREAFDEDTFNFLARTLPRLSKKRIVPISCRPETQALHTLYLG
jgi:DNA polymerase-3 subunit epsilon